MDSKMQQAHDWLQDPQALHGGVGEKSVRQVGWLLIENDINHLFKRNKFYLSIDKVAYPISNFP